MASTGNNTAKQLPDTEAVDEPSMEEILASIKQIIADDEPLQDGKSERDQYTYPDSHSNSNVTLPPEFDEAEIQAALMAELEAADSEETVVAETPAAIEEVTLDDKAAQIRAELTAVGAGLTADERIEKYRNHGKLQLEVLAAEQAKKEAKLAPVVAATPSIAMPGPLLPTTNAIAQEMAATMMIEKSGEIQNLLADMMRPTVRQWLSDNLPSLVEKLVREEIEAVSRGRKSETK